MTQALQSMDLWRLSVVGAYVLGAVLLMAWLGLAVAREAAIATLRAAAQLAVMGSVLVVAFEVDRPWLSLALLLVMVTVAAWTSARRVNPWRSTLLFALGAITLTSVSIVVPMALAGVIELRPSFLIPICGMVIGNAMNATALALERLQSNLSAQRDRVEAYLSLGVDSRTATKALAESTLTSSLIPSLNSLKTTGIVHIPGMMTGMLIAGENALKAAEMQLTILYLIFVASLLSSLMVTHLGRRLYFTDFDALRLPGACGSHRS